MGLYENMLILQPDMESEEEAVVLRNLQETITKNDGSIVKVVDWHKRKLAYEINKHKEGHYYLVYFDAPGTIIPEVEHYFRVTDAIMRFMIVSANESDLEAVSGEEPVPSSEVADVAAEEEKPIGEETDINADEQATSETTEQPVEEKADQLEEEEKTD
ncbi:MAG: 30S ribosomal protein S6 [Bacillota bacterium]|nr:30S ribosomal protein S6 [Bacillota bacterium]